MLQMVSARLCSDRDAYNILLLTDVDHSFTRSLFWPNEATCQGHPRFRTIARNIWMRRREKVCINVPVYPDENTPPSYLEDLSQFGDDGTSQAVSEPGKSNRILINH